MVALLTLLFLPSASSAASTDDRYSLVNGCFALQDASSGSYVQKGGGTYAATAPGLGGAEPFRMQATALGRYLFYGANKDFLSLSSSGPLGGSAVKVASDPSNATDLTVDKNGPGGGFTVVNKFNDNALAVGGNGKLTSGGATEFNFVETSGCATYPEITTNVDGEPTTGETSYGETEGLLEGHMHHMAFRFLGGAHCGKPWDRFGVEYALDDCADHKPSGCAAVLDTFLGGDPCHDPTGWPKFTDWPAPNSLTHEQSYYKWLERAHQSGLRVFVNLMVQNRVLCEIYPINPNNNPCDDSDTVELELDEAYALQDYVDAQAGGPGKGFYQIVKNPFKAREVINDGKLAVILGVEVSEPFHCRMFMGVPTCDKKQITKEIQHLYDRGVRQMEITNKFDNALTGVAGDDGETGVLVNSGNFYATGRFWDLEQCQTDDVDEHDKEPSGVPVHNEDQILGRMIEEYLPPGATPVYPEGPLCNTAGLSELGEHAIDELMNRGMIFDPDHMSVKGRDAALNQVESARYPGIISSHGWSTPSALPRIYKLGGIVTPYAGDSEGFVHNYEEAKDAYRGRQFFGIGYGADQNGFGGQGGPRGADVPNPVNYPFKSFNGEQTINKQQSGSRTYDINVDGVAHYGLYPDWIEDLRQLAGNEIIEDMGNGAESYLQMWERAEGVPKVRCPVWKQGGFNRAGLTDDLRLGATTKKTLYQSGQPVERTDVWQWCTRFKKGADKRELGKKRRITGVFDKGGRMRVALSTLARHDAGGLGRGDRKRKLKDRATALGSGIWVQKGSRDRNVYVYGTKGKKVRFAGVASKKIAASDGKLRRFVERAGLK